MNIDTEFQRLATECDALLERNQNIFDEKQDLETSINRLKVANERDSKTIQDVEQLHEADIMRLQLNALEAQNKDYQKVIPRLEEHL
jgi:chaperonin cofactor prefoldin